MNNKVYLAGPDVFREDADEYFKNLCDVLISSGLDPKTPLDFSSTDPYDIYLANIEILESCDFVMANLDIFRGPSVDAGTAIEIGYAKALGKRVVGYYNSPESLNYYSRAKMFGVDLPYPKIEDFNLSDNLMVVYSCEEIFEDINVAIKYIAMEARIVT